MKKPLLRYFRREFNAMGTPCEIQLFAAGKAAAMAAADAAIADVQRLEARYSRYRNDSFLSEINRAAAVGAAIEVDEETAGLLDYAATCYAQSDGLFDITSGILRRAWKFDSGQLPEQSLLDELLQCVGWHKLSWQRPWLTFTVPGMEIDFGGVVKEYAVDRAAALCIAHGIRHGLVNLGGDIKVVGPRADGSPWQIGIRHPHHPGSLLDTLALTAGAVASSGDYERCITLNGARYGHVLNPRTGWPVRHLAAVTVFAEFCVVAGSASTIAMLKEGDGPAWLADLQLPHLWVDVNGFCGGSPELGIPPSTGQKRQS
ncbi:FAD:protein FMN transferase [Methylomonas sp. SURF-1]|uniref:FAD:protein FMN transferase n=1 Tax=Methylomonas aurea TaxID=2952224 RepID=A0ABT1UKS1_9GAMM|nr:FAD:protein FMN transferase [Methylomonas sp. SURF-1]MCQ8182433.1 FAD:protein FMN transferase [Methylomonas sp. SURF-1]